MATIFRDENVYRVTPKIVVIHFNHNHDKPGRLRGTLLTLLCLSHIPLDPTYQEQTDLKSEPTQQFHKLYPAEAFLLLGSYHRSIMKDKKEPETLLCIKIDNNPHPPA